MANNANLGPVLLLSFYVSKALADNDQSSAESSGSNEAPDWLKDAHATLATVSWIVFFPVGSILIRTLHKPKTWLIHASVQVFASVLFIVGAGLGVELAVENSEIDEYHCIIGLFLLALIFIQAIGGVMHHLRYKKYQKRTIVSQFHIWIGRIIITLGMVNGGLGLELSSEEEAGKLIAYGVVAGLIWLVWMSIDVWAATKSQRTQALAHDNERQSKRLITLQRKQ